jgi:hypothetical protein
LRLEPLQNYTMAAEVDYGYGDMDYGYGEPDPEPEPINNTNLADEAGAANRRPKRRCSVTKFSLPEETPLNAASIINDMRNGTVTASEPALVTEDRKDANANAVESDMEAGDDANNERSAPGRQRSGVLRFLKRR